MPDEDPADGSAGVSFADDEVSFPDAPSRPTFANGDLFAAVEESVVSARPLVELFFGRSSTNEEGGTLTGKQRRDALSSLVRSPKFNKSHSRRLFAGLLPLLKTIAEEERFVPDEDNEGNVIEDAEAESTSAIRFLRCCAHLVEAYLDGLLKRQGAKSRRSAPKRLEVIDEAFETAEVLHELLFPLHACGTTEARLAKNAIFDLCEKWWHGNFEDREQVVTQLVPLLLVKSLDASAQKNDVKRLYSIREAIDLLDFRDESIASLKQHLLRVVGNPLFLQSAEGRKFIAHLFLVDASLVGDLHRAMRAQIVGAKKSILNAYAEIYFQSWKAAGELSHEEDGEEEEEVNEIRTAIEENALQDLVYQVIHAAVPSTAKSVRTVLDKFYVHKKSPDVEGMLHRTHGPLLWRGLAATSSKIRKQAAGVLTDTFPLRDPEAGTEHTEACLKKSVEALISLMKDDTPSVRVEGSKSTARILTEFWSAVPSKDIRRLLNCLIAKHASDETSPAVRAAAVNAVATLLEEDKTHAVLRPLLPSLGNLIHDKTERVRLAVVNMLLLVKRLRGMKYYHVVSAENLLARLADEGRGRNNPTGTVARGLSDLLSNSFFPTGSKRTAADVVNRTLRLLKDNREAAVTFYRNASSQLSVGSISRLIAALMRCLCYFVVEEKRCEGEDVTNLSLVLPEDGAIEGRGGKSDTALMATIAESVSILWGSIEEDLKDEENGEAVEILMEVFSGGMLTEVYCHFEAKCAAEGELEESKMEDCFRACGAILNSAGRMDETAVYGLRAHVIGQLSKSSELPPEKQMTVNFGPNVALLCAWGMTEEIAQCLASSISQYFSDDIDASFTRKSRASRKRKPRGKKQASDDALPQLEIDVSLITLGHILRSTNATARESILQSESAFTTLASALKTAQSAAERLPSSQGGSATKMTRVCMAIECYGKLLMHKEAAKGVVPMKLTPELKGLTEWLANTMVPKLAPRKDNALGDLDISGISVLGSPIGAPPPRKMTRASTRASSSVVGGQIGDASFMSTQASNVFNNDNDDNEPSSSLAFTRPMKTVLDAVVEWQAVGLAVDEPFLSHRVAQMCEVLEHSDPTVQIEILPALFHIAITSLANGGGPSLLKQVLLGMKNADVSQEEEEILAQSMTFVGSLRDESVLKATVSMIIHVTRTLVVEAEEDASAFDSPFLDKVGSCMRKVLGGIMGDKKCSLLLAQCLINESKASSVRECLLQEIELQSPQSDALARVLGEWKAEKGKLEDTTIEEADKENADANQIPPEMIVA
ncbi:hypothetical protein ACHAXT_004124 [Thalassiosira profunda]